jgi:hypothetical protein
MGGSQLFGGPESIPAREKLVKYFSQIISK